jgi:hypothetical protein
MLVSSSSAKQQRAVWISFLEREQLSLGEIVPNAAERRPSGLDFQVIE